MKRFMPSRQQQEASRRTPKPGTFIALLKHQRLLTTYISLGYTEKAVVSARAARKKRWICFFLTLIILVIVGIVVAVVIVQNNKK
jgi:hypothetical protein